APPADWIPIELKPAATYRPRSSGASPRRYRSSGVKLSGPLKNTCTPADSSAGTRLMAAAKSGSMWPRSAGKCSKAKSSGIPCQPGLRLGLEPADEELAGVLLEVRARIGVAQDRQVGREARDRLSHDVEVLGRMERHADSRPGADLACPQARAVHHGV